MWESPQRKFCSKTGSGSCLWTLEWWTHLPWDWEKLLKWSEHPHYLVFFLLADVRMRWPGFLIQRVYVATLATLSFIEVTAHLVHFTKATLQLARYFHTSTVTPSQCWWMALRSCHQVKWGTRGTCNIGEAPRHWWNWSGLNGIAETLSVTCQERFWFGFKRLHRINKTP